MLSLWARARKRREPYTDGFGLPWVPSDAAGLELSR